MKRSMLLLCCLLLLSGCHRHAKQVFALPPAPPEIAPVMVSVPPPTHPTEPLPAPIKPVVTVAPPPEKPAKKPSRIRRVPPATTAIQPPASGLPAPAQTASAATPPAAPPISLGQLSAGGETAGNLRQQTIDLIHSQTQRVSGLQNAFVNEHKDDVEQTRLYIRQAQESWNTSDVEAAHTLATKAKVLLDDLLK